VGPTLRCAIAISWIVALARPAVAVESGAYDDVRGQLSFRTFAGADGLRNLVINSIAQDGDGFLWVGTDDGVDRFDGERFTHFSTSDGMTSTQVLVVGIAPAGEPCLGSSVGMVCWDGRQFSQTGARGLPAVPVHGIASFAGKLWVATEGSGLMVRDASGVFSPAPGWTGARNVRAMWADAEGLVVGDGDSVQLSSGDGVWRRIDLASAEVANNRARVDGVLRDREGALWIRSASHLWVLPKGATRATDLHDGLPDSYIVAGVPPGMAIGPRGNVLLGTDRGIAYRDNGRWRLIDRSLGISARQCRTVFVDREGTIWVGSGGLTRMRGRGLIERHDLSSGLPGDAVWSLGRDPQGTMYLGTNHCLARAKSGTWECVPGTEGRTVRSFVFPPQGGIFVGGSPSDLLYIDSHGHATSLGDTQRPEGRTILALALGPDGDLWIATETGVDRLPDALPGRQIEHVAIPGTRPDGRFASLLMVGQQVWTSDEQGIVVLDNGRWHLFDKTAGFRASAMRYLALRSDGRICVSYNEAIGVTCFRYGAGRVSQLEHITPADGISGMVYYVGEDHQRRLWVGTGAGVDVVTAHGIDHFDQSDGHAGDDAAATAFFADRDGSIWLGANGGATHVFAQYYRGPLEPPRVSLLDARIGDASLLAGRTVEVPHDHNSFMIDFAPTSLLDPKQLEYQVRLLPMEREWTTTRQRVIRYPAISPDAYRFEVRARIGAGDWGPPRDVRFTVRPPWWQTSWFFAAIATTGLLAIGGGFAWRQRTVLRRRTRQLHEQSEASFRAVIDLMPDLISVWRDRKMIYLNMASRRFLGIDRESDDWKAAPLADLVHPSDRAQVAELLRRASILGPHETSEVIELQMRAADGGWRACEISAILVEIAGAPTVVASGRDITERKRLRAKLLVSDRMASLGTLAAGIAHEINNPLAYVTGNLEAITEALQTAKRTATPADCDELAAVVGDACDGAERVRKIVHGLRAFSRSKEEEQRVTLAVGDVLEAAIRMTGNEVRHRAQLIREFGPVPLVAADDGRLTQVFINLLINAAHAIPEGHSNENRITIRTRTDHQRRAVIEIEDTGQGMPPEIQARVFDPFFTTKDVGEGTGLGLSICHGIISGLGGQISVDSTLGHGTTMRVVLAAAPDVVPAPVAAPISEPSPSSNARRHRVMLVDDEVQVAHTMERLLRRDYDITVALCGNEAIEHIMNGARFDAIISDVMMPNMTGVELTEQLQQLAPDQARRLIFLSGGAFTAQTRDRLDELGAPQLEKPVSAKELRAHVARMVTEAKP
jgi:PAS domain S-box-containing protein